MRIYIILNVLIISFVLCACGRQVEVVQSQQFKLMADRMPNELIARDILDSSRDYVAGVWATNSFAYGEILYTRLSPVFLFDDVVKIEAKNSFAEMVAANPKSNSAVMRKHGFGFVNIEKARKGKSQANIERRIDVDMVAITDWNGDGKQDWIIACKLLRTRGAVPRIYYVVVQNPPVSGMLQGHTVAVYDDMGAFGRLYLRESAAPSSAPVEDVVPGLRPVTTPPKETTPKSEGIKERTLD